jgi:antitoxin (DNA-binding transcriptional repressor) of toxin-antitoxin stability system
LVHVHQVKTHLSQLLQEVEQGQELVTSRFGVSIALLLLDTQPGSVLAERGDPRRPQPVLERAHRRRRRRCS